MRELPVTDGYPDDVPCSFGAYPRLLPGHIDWIHVLNGEQPPLLDDRFVWLELGCGHGVTAVMVAAAHPRAEVYAIDANPAHIRFARQLATQVGVSNCTFLEADLRTLANDPETLPVSDYIVSHGLYSWVSPEVREAVHALLHARLRTGGAGVVSYNCLPGAATMAAIGHYLRTAASESRGRSSERVRTAVEALRGFRDSGRGIFASSDGSTRAALASLFPDDSEADFDDLAHEYLTPHWRAFYHDEVVREMDGLGLRFVGRATPAHAFAALTVDESMGRAIEAYADPACRETALDAMLTPLMRMDVYVRGSRPLAHQERAEWLRSFRLTTTVAPERLAEPVSLPLGRGRLDPALAGLGGDALADATVDLVRFSEVVAEAGYDDAAAVRTLAVWSHSERLVVSHPRHGVPDGERVERFNQAAAQCVRRGQTLTTLMEPTAGAPVRIGAVEILVLQALRAGCSPSEATLAHEVMTGLGHSPMIEPPERVRAAVRRTLHEVAPRARRLGLLGAESTPAVAEV